MSVSRLTAWAREVPTRMSQIPWREIAGEGFDKFAFLVKFACVTHVANRYIFGFAYVMGPSMLPTINLSGDIVLLDKMSPLIGNVRVGDVVVLQSPENPRKSVTKRVLGMEGDEITFLVDPGNGDKSKTVVVPKDHLWVQGDNIYASRDSRRFGSVPYGLVRGRVFIRVWPFDSFGFLNKEK